MKTRRSFLENCLRLFCLFLGLFVLAQGLAFTVAGDLGTDAITSPALVGALALGDGPGGMGYSFFTVGRLLICVHVLMVLLQIILLRRNYQPVQLLQVVMGFILGGMLDFCQTYTSLLPHNSYALSLLYTVVGCVLCAFGIFTYVKADMVPLSAEGLCLALSRTFSWRFSRVKVAVDCTFLAIAVVASLLIWGEIVGVREGSLICALCTGYLIGCFFRICPIWDKLFAKVRGGTASADDTSLS